MIRFSFHWRTDQIYCVAVLPMREGGCFHSVTVAEERSGGIRDSPLKAAGWSNGELVV